MSGDCAFDVVIVGAGGAGLAAAIESAAAGARTIVFEKEASPASSSTAIAVGRFSFAGTDIQLQQGVHDSNERLYADIMATGRQCNDQALVRAYVDHQLAGYEWLCSLGVRWSPTVTAVAGMSVARGHLTDARVLVETLHRAAVQRGAHFDFATPVAGLMTTDGHVHGVTLADGRRIAARDRVILACGGFARDPERLRRIDPRFGEVVATSGPGHTGDGLRMAEALGAETRDIEHVQPSFELHERGSTSADIALFYYRGGVIVNRRGERFVNESISYKDIARACLDQPGRVGYQIFDQRVFDEAVAAQAASGQSSPMTLDAHKIGLLECGTTIAVLASRIGVPAVTLESTLAQYNADVVGGTDRAFGRRTLAGDVGTSRRLDAPPFYAFATIGHLLATYGGITVDARMRVLAGGRPIPGLYAAGEAIGGFHGASYHSGTALGKAVLFGRIAGGLS